MKRILPFIALAAVSVLSMFSCQQEPAEIRVSSISLSKSTLELTVGDQASLDATVSPDNATNKKIRWSSSKESVATVTPDGIVEAVSVGTSFITARSEDSGVNAKCEITVKEKVISVTGIALNKTSLSLTEGEEFTLEATVTPDNATNKEISWTSDNEAVVTVSVEGVVKTLSAGSANVTVTTVDQGKTASCTITVDEKFGAVTGEATHISCRNAMLSGKVNLPQTTSTNLSFGVLYSTSSGVLLGSATQLEAKEFDAYYNYTIDTGVLEPETTYYYRSYIIQNEEVEYGQTKSFKTLAVSSMIQTLDASDIYLKEATLNAMLDLTDCNYSSIEYGFELTPEGSQAKTLVADNLADKSFSYLDISLVMNTGYSYVAYVRLDDILYKGETKTFTTTSIQASVSAEASDIQYYSAIISGSLTVQSEGSFSKSAVLYYSKTENTVEGLKSNGIKKTLTLGADGSYTAALSSLSSFTSYNFIVVAKVDDVELVTEVKSFKTLSIQASVSAEASEVQCNSAKISGSLTVQSEGSFSKSAVLYYSSSESTLDGLKSNGTKKTLTLGADGSYSETLSSLSSSTSYNFVVVAKVDDVDLITEVKSFKTLKHPYELTYDLNVSSATDLSSAASANCYIISEAGLYKFKTVKGNSTTSVGSVASASILWETFGTDTAPELLDLISGFCYKDGYIAFQTADTFKEGNAVIAAKDADGNILWSWHIWFTDQPQAQVYKNNAGTMMDRNLGATSATPGDVGALGLLYQWGRKDPFLGSSSISSNTIAKSTIVWPSAVSSNSSNGTIDYATGHPTTFINNSSNYDWYYTGSSSTDNTRWTTSSSDKSIYDPCPAGWRVPDGGSNGIWSKAGFDDTTFDSTNEGISFSISSPSKTWYPASGYRYYRDGGLDNVGNRGRYWSASPSSNNACGLNFSNSGYVDPFYNGYRAFGYSVRCLQE